MNRILVIEDDPSITSFVKISLKTVGYEVATAPCARAGLEILNDSPVDLVILDLMLPDAEGISLLPVARKKEVPVLILTARDGLMDKVRGLEGGADDYMTKPFESLELIARVRTVLRRYGRDTRNLNVAGLDIDVDARMVSRSGTQVALTRKEFDLLLYLAEHKGMALSREQLLEVVWGYNYAGATRTVDVHVRRLREKLATDAIKTVTGTGYRLEG